MSTQVLSIFILPSFDTKIPSIVTPVGRRLPTVPFLRGGVVVALHRQCKTLELYHHLWSACSACMSCMHLMRPWSFAAVNAIIFIFPSLESIGICNIPMLHLQLGFHSLFVWIPGRQGLVTTSGALLLSARLLASAISLRIRSSLVQG